MTLASFLSWADQFESYLIENLEDRFSRDKAHIEERGPVVQLVVHQICSLTSVMGLRVRAPAQPLTGLEIIFTAILSLLLIQVGQLLVTGESLCT